jgi:hypothetical protein
VESLSGLTLQGIGTTSPETIMKSRGPTYLTKEVFCDQNMEAQINANSGRWRLPASLEDEEEHV